MKKFMKPFSALYYINKNRKRALICIFMFILSVFIHLGGNYIAANEYAFKGSIDIYDKVVLISALSSDEDFIDFNKLLSEVRDDEKLDFVMRSAYGYRSMKFKSVLGLEMTDSTMVFNSKKDMEKVFKRIGIKGDFSDCKNGSIILSRAMANQKGFKKGDIIDKEADEMIDGEYSVDAIYDSNMYTSFIIDERNENLYRIYIFSDELEGEDLYNYVAKIVDGKKVQMDRRYKLEVDNNFFQFEIMFYAIDIFIAIVLAVTVNSVLTGQYIKRTYEFGIYNAIGIGKKRVKRKVLCEVLLMDIIAIVFTITCTELYTFLMNELFYKERGLYLVYTSKMGIVGALLCNILIVIPVIFLKGRLVSKVDITEF